MLPILSVSNVNHYLKGLLDEDGLLQDLWVQGEVSNLSRSSTGHVYFSLKDSAAVLRCVLFRNQAQRWQSQLTDGRDVVLHGRLSVYEGWGAYQLYVDFVQREGAGLAYMKFEQLKAKLSAEGLLDAERKRPLSAMPRCIGVVTSPSGAALQDILNILRRRFPLGDVVISPTLVQGDEAPAQIVAALRSLNDVPGLDVIIVARGGGSTEELWAFNDERVARAICASPVPVVTGVGHEVDFTIADLAADVRAPTPSAAAELATPDRREIQAALAECVRSICANAEVALVSRQAELAHWINALERLKPLDQIQRQMIGLDDLYRRLQRAMVSHIESGEKDVAALAARLQCLSPHETLARGYAIIRDVESGHVVRSATAARPGMAVRTWLADGSFDSRVLGREDDDNT